MEDFDKIASEIRSYQSPLDIDAEWKSLVLKKDNNLQKKKASKRNFILLICFLLITCFFVLWCYNVNLHYPQNEDHIISQKNKAEVENGIVDINENRPLKEIDTELDLKSTKSLTKTKAATEVTIRNSDSSLFENSIEKLDSIAQSKNHLIPEISQNKSAVEVAKEKHLSDIEEHKSKAKERIELVKIPTKKASNIRLETSEAFSLPDSKIINAIKNNDKNNFILFELFGQGGFYSFNYGRRIARQKIGETDIRVGLSLNPQKIYGQETGLSPFLVPVSINQSIHLATDHHLTIGLGSTLAYDKNALELSKYYLLGNIKLGYKFHSPGKRFFYTAELLSSHEFRNIFTSWMDRTSRLQRTQSFISGGVGIGYTF